jgi:hypothetical protein
MEIKNRIKSFLPHIIAVLFFTIISFVYYYPVLEGKVLKANDSSVATYNSKEISDFRKANDKEPLWTNSIFSGMPAYLILIKHPGNLMKKVDIMLRQYPMPVSVLFLSLIGFYILLLFFKVDPWLSIAGSIAFGFSSFFFLILGAGHNTQAIALAYMAPMIGGIYWAYRYNAVKGALFTAFILSLEILANHPQITYYGLMCLLVFIIIEFIYSVKEKTILRFIKTSAIMIVPFIIAIGINFSNLYSVYEYSKYSIRGKTELVNENRNTSTGLDRSYITYWSYGVDETMNLLIPDYKGGSSKPFAKDSETVKALRKNNMASYADGMPKYWGQQPGTDGPHYVGAIMIFLFILGLMIVKGREKWWLLIATILSVMLSWGKNFMPLTNLFIDFFPGYNKFRAVTMILVIAQFCIPLLGVLALRDIFNGSVNRKEILKSLKIATAITGGIVLLILLIPGISGSFLNQWESDYPDWLKNALITDRKELLRSDAFKSLVFILFASVAVFCFLYEKIRKEFTIAILGLLILIDLWGADKRYLNGDRFVKPAVLEKSVSPSIADKFILNDKSYFRVLNLSVATFSDNSPTSYLHKSIGGYHGAKIRRYQDLIDSAISRNIDLFGAAAKNAKSEEELFSVFNSTSAINMLNAKYIIYNPEAPPLLNSRALGNAWFVENPIIVNNANEELSRINALNPASEAVIDKRFSNLITGKSFPVKENDKIELKSYQPNELLYSTFAETEKLAVFSEIYYPAGWRCFIDGTETTYFRANYILRAMIVPAGEHEIRFVFEPDSYYKGNKVSLASSILLFLLLAGYFGNELRKRLINKTNGAS